MRGELNRQDAKDAKKYGRNVGGYVIPAEAGIQSLLTDWQRLSKRELGSRFRGNDALGQEIDSRPWVILALFASSRLLLPQLEVGLYEKSRRLFEEPRKSFPAA